jgi:capsular polysaccharide export protein
VPSDQRRFLFLQGPPGPFFRLLGAALKDRGQEVMRVNLNGGDAHDWPPRNTGVKAWRGPPLHWSGFIARLLRDRRITDLVLFGDCRPHHRAAILAAATTGTQVHVVEEGYLRPHWLTLEQGGVNGHSSLPRAPHTYLEQAARLSPPAGDMPPVEAAPGRRMRDTATYFTHMVLRSPAWPFYRSHRPGSILGEGVGWLLKHRARPRSRSETRAALDRIARWRAQEGRVMLFPLQLSSDYQIRTHSPFATMALAAAHVLADFAAHAPADMALLVKEHPLDATPGGWTGWITRTARALGQEHRVIPIPGGDLRALCEDCAGLVTVNSTSATFALAAGVPVAALGHAVYALPGLTHQGALRDFWQNPAPPDPILWDAFTRVLHHRCLIRGGLASSEAVAMAVENATARLLRGPFLPNP